MVEKCQQSLNFYPVPCFSDAEGWPDRDLSPLQDKRESRISVSKEWYARNEYSIPHMTTCGNLSIIKTFGTRSYN